MSSSAPEPKKKSSRLSLWIRLGCLLVFVGYTAFVAGYHLFYQNHLFPGLRFEGQDVGGLSSAAFEARFPQWQEQKTGELAKKIHFRVNGTPLVIDTRHLIIGEAPNAWAQLSLVGRTPTDPFFYAPFLLKTGFIPSSKTTLALRLDTDLTQKRLQTAVAPLEKAAKDAAIELTAASAEDLAHPVLEISPEEPGVHFALQGAVQRLQTAIKTKSGAYQIDLEKTEATAPTLTKERLQPLLATAQGWVDRGPLALKDTEGHTWTISRADLARWLIIRVQDGNLSLSLASPTAFNDLEQRTKSLWHEAHDGRLTMDGTKLVSLEAPQNGWHLDTTSTLLAVQQGLEHNSSSIPAVFTAVAGHLQGEAAEQLGIIENLGSGHSAFPGSPANRRKNIALGAEKVNGTLVAPGEEFSLLHVLGEIDGEHGWLPELVIKGNKTTPEFGGGLCQIGTTVFRGATNVGLPITERRNHSYRVAYYEPAGTDATIYSPAPDFKFKNDTAHSILITKRILKDEVWFDFWGTKDGRSVVKTSPRIFNIVEPPAQKTIETTDLPVGKTKCTEKAHAGASASFDYQVTYATGEQKKVTFNSYYKPWQAVCLVGVAQLSVNGSTTTSTQSTVPLSPDQSTPVTP